MNYNYIRYVDHGALSGFCESQCNSWSTNCVLDTIATSTDIKRLATLRRKKREKEIDKVFARVSYLSMTQYSKLSVCLLLMEDDGQQIRHYSHGTCFQGETLVTRCQQHIIESGVQIDHMQKLHDIVSMPPLSLNFRMQLAVINCLPAVNVSFTTANCTSRHCVAEGRVRTSCKYMFVRDEFKDINSLYAAGASAVTFRKQGSSRKGAINAFGTESEDYDSDCCEMDDTPVSIGNRTSFSVPVVEKFKFNLQRQGLVRVIKKSDSEIDIIWNKFDSLKCKCNAVHFSKKLFQHCRLQ